MGGSKAYPYGSTSAVRGHVLAASGVLKVASADQIHRLMAPGHKDNKAFRNALPPDLRPLPSVAAYDQLLQFRRRPADGQA